MTAFAYRGSDTYNGDAYFICDRCSQRHRRSNMCVEWTNLRVDAKCLDPRPPQMEPPDVYPEGLPFPDARPPQDNPDRLTDETTLYPFTGGVGATDGTFYTAPNGQTTDPGGLSPRDANVSYIPALVPLVPGQATLEPRNILEDDISLRTGPVFAPSVT